MSEMTYAEMFTRLVGMTAVFWGALMGLRIAITEIRRVVEHV